MLHVILDCSPYASFSDLDQDFWQEVGHALQGSGFCAAESETPIWQPRERVLASCSRQSLFLTGPVREYGLALSDQSTSHTPCAVAMVALDISDRRREQDDVQKMT